MLTYMDLPIKERIDIYQFIPPPLPLMDRDKLTPEYFVRSHPEKQHGNAYRPVLARDRFTSRTKSAAKDGYAYESVQNISPRASHESEHGLRTSVRYESSGLPPLPGQLCMCKNGGDEYLRTKESLGAGGSPVPIVYKDNVNELFQEAGNYEKFPCVYTRPRPDCFKTWVDTLLDPNLPSYLNGEVVTATACSVHKAKVQSRTSQRTKALSHSEFSFDSEFEGGNLDRVVKMRDNEFHLFLTCDSNTKGYTQWFYFSVRNVHKDVSIVLNLVNFSKNGSPFARGMRPGVFSQVRHRKQSVSWTRGGFDVRYIKNPIPKTRKGTYFTLAFSYTFQYDHDTVYFAYSEPYTYTRLMRFLGDTKQAVRGSQDMRYEEKVLAETIGGLKCPYLTISDRTSATKKIVGISARVHPGETVGSFMVEGFIKFITSNNEEAISLRRSCVFLIIPMLNPDGVLMGNTRTGLAGVDLNRRWDAPNPVLHPVISAAKELLTKAVCFIDLHGHSKKDFCFMYGNSFNRKDDRYWTSRFLPVALAKLTPHFSYSLSYFFNSHSHDKAARTVMFNEKGVLHSFTLEASFNASFNQDRKTEFTAAILREIGWKLGEAVYGLVQILFKRSGKDVSTQEGIYGLANLLATRLKRAKDRHRRSATLTAPLPSPEEIPEPLLLEPDLEVERVSEGSDSDPSEDDLDATEKEEVRNAIAGVVEEHRVEAVQESSYPHETSSYHFKDPLEAVLIKFDVPDQPQPRYHYRPIVRPLLRRQLQESKEAKPLISSRKYTQVLQSLRRNSQSPDVGITPKNPGFESYLQFVRAVRQKMTRPRLPPM